MDNFWDATLFSLVMVASAGLIMVVLYLVRTQARMLHIQSGILPILTNLGRAQAALLADIKDVEGNSQPLSDSGQSIALHGIEHLFDGGWRDLSEDDQRTLKAGLIVLLAEMNSPYLTPVPRGTP